MTQDIAVIGLAGRFPGAADIDEFWGNLAAGVNAIGEIPPDRWDHQAYREQTGNKWGGFLKDWRSFDAGFFAISPREAKYMDPQQRLLLEVAWHCVEEAGLSLASLRQQPTGVYLGAMTMDYWQVTTDPQVEIDGFSGLGSYSCILSNRLSHVLGLSGPSLTLDTACSSSLVAIHLARQALLSGECELAFAGGVTLNHRPWKHLSFSRARMLSPTGQCRTFDAQADGYVPGEGCGVLLLQPLERAIAQNRRIFGVIRGSAVNHSAVGESITAPNVGRQARLLKAAYADAQVDPATVTYVEAHGTGTSLGDPIEMEALSQAFRTTAQAIGYCQVGSVKTNIGHLEAAAGIAGVIKVLMMLQHRQIPASLNLTTPNPLIDFTTSPFVPAVALGSWEPAAVDLPLRAGVSSFGFGGSNAHLVLEEPPRLPVVAEGAGSPLALATGDPGQGAPEMGDRATAVIPFLLSAKSARSLAALVAQWGQEGAQRVAAADLGTIAANLALGRESFPLRFGCLASSWADVQRALAQFELPSQPVAATVETPSESRSTLGRLVQDPEALKALWASVALPEADWESVLQVARTLWRRQMTFTRFVETWRQPLAQAGIDLDSVLQAPLQSESSPPLRSAVLQSDSLRSNAPRPEHRILVFVAIRSSLARLCQKWDLTDRYPTGSAALAELARAFTVGVLDPAMDWPVLLSGLLPDRPRPATELPEVSAPEDVGNSVQSALAAWLAGRPVDWSAHFPATYPKLSLPRYPFDRQLYWLFPKTSEGDRPAPLPAATAAREVLPSSGASSERWEQVFPETDLVLRSHFLNGRWILPAASFIGLAWDAVTRSLGRSPGLLTEITLHQAVALGVGDAEAVTLGAQVELPNRVQVWQRDRLILSATFTDSSSGSLLDQASGRSPDSHAVGRDGVGEISGTAIYAALRSRGYQYGRALQVIHQAQITDEVATFQLQAPNRTAFLDGILQAAVYLHQQWFAERGSDSRDFVVPGQVAGCWWGSQLQAQWESSSASAIAPTASPDRSANPATGEPASWVTVRFERQQCRAQATESQFSAIAIGTDGRPLAMIRELTLAAAPLLAPEVSYFETDWTVLPAATASPTQTTAAPTIIFAQGAAWGLALRQRLRSQGIEAQLCLAGSTFEVLGDRVCQWDWTDPDQVRQGLTHLLAPEQLRAIAGADAIDSPLSPALVYWVTAPPAAGSGHGPRGDRDWVTQAEADLNQGVRGCFLFLQQWVKVRPADPLQLLAVTFDAQAVTPSDRVLGFATAGIDALGRTVALELPQIRLKSVDLALGLTVGEASAMIAAEAATPWEHDRVAYRGGDRYGAELRAVAPGSAPPLPVSVLEPGSCILITGGSGALAAEVAEAIALQTAVHFLLVGRSPRRAQTDQLIALLESLGSTADYLQADLCQEADLDRFTETLKTTHRAIHGVIHTAGQLDDRLFHAQTLASLDRLIAPKFLGALRLEQRLQDQPVAFWLGFSSITVAAGNPGQANYVVANRLLEAFCAYRNRHWPGRTGAIQWGLWRSRGMGATDMLAERFQRSGMEPFSAAAGRFAFLDVLTSDRPQPVLVTGKGTDATIFERFSRSRPASNVAPALPAPLAPVAIAPSAPPPPPTPSIATIEQELAALVARTLNTDPQSVPRQEGFFSLGLESLMIEEIVATLEKQYSGLRPTVLFDYPNIKVLATHLAQLTAPAGSTTAPATSSPVAPSPAGPVPGSVAPAPTQVTRSPNPVPFPEPQALAAKAPNLKTPDIQAPDAKVPDTGATNTQAPIPQTQPLELPDRQRPPGGYDIAIIGIDGCYPQSPDLETFWQNLYQGRSCVTEVPPNRWDYQPYFAETKQPNRTYGKWGGFIPGVEEFDPLFFNIAPKEAKQIDPQARLFLQSVWHTMENAGYGSRQSRQGERVGLFVGAMWHDYSHVARDLSWSADQPSGAGALFWIIANRVSHFLDFTGPSLAIDTACSSSLTAIHLACQSLLAGDCTMAVAGGVSLTLHPFRYLYLSQWGFLSRDGRCRSFGEGGDGYVPGEGVGAVLLKPLARARADGDFIWGVIRGSGINHGGRVNGFTVPSGPAQTESIERSLAAAGIQFGDLQYVECHGTGTALGDPIEVGGLATVAQRQGYQGDQIPLGSVKSNIGHLEAASGMAGLTKVLLAMRHDTIPGTLHCNPPNPNIAFSELPFRVLAQAQPWPKGDRPRFSCVNSFGAGGSNAHLILEDWPTQQPKSSSAGPWLIVLSARTANQLTQQASQLHRHLRTERPSLDDVAWTLQGGREPLAERLALVSDRLDTLLAQLATFRQGQLPAGGWRGQVLAGADPMPAPVLPESGMPTAATLALLAQAWTQGAEIDWQRLRSPGSQRIPLPGYPFAKDAYWLTSAAPPPFPPQGSSLAPAQAQTAPPTNSQPTSRSAAPLPTRRSTVSGDGEAIAIVGMGCHFPNAQNPAEFWANLLAGRSSIEELPPDFWHRPASSEMSPFSDLQGAIDPNAPSTPPRWAGRITPRSPSQFSDLWPDGMTQTLDPGSAELLSIFAETLQDAGYGVGDWRGESVGLFVSTGVTFAPGLAAQLFGWRGPSLVLNATDSASLGALHLACQSLRSGECRAALVAGLHLLEAGQLPASWAAAKLLSPDGQHRAFDAAAKGTVLGEGGGALLLRPLSQAIAEGDRIYAVIESSAIAQDGPPFGLPLPTVTGQQRVIEQAWARSGLDPAALGYLEAHGLATPLSDPVELKALSQAIRQHTAATQFCAIGCVKNNIGHLFSAAGMASLIKTALILHHGQIPPTLHCDHPHPRLNLEQSPFFLARQAQPWPSQHPIRRAAVSSFGLDGSNSHAILRDFSPMVAVAADFRTPQEPQSRSTPVAAGRSAASPSYPALLSFQELTVSKA